MLRRIAYAIAVVILGVPAGILAIGWPTGHPPTRDASTDTLRIASANLNFENSHADASEVLAGVDADLLLVLEWTGHNLNLEPFHGNWVAELDRPSRGAHGVLILRRRTLAARASLVPTPVPGPCPMPIATVRVRVGRRWLSILGVHVPPPIEECEATNEPTLVHLAGLVEAGRMRADLGECKGGEPVVLTGDFNALPWSPDVRRFRTVGLVDAFSRRHWRPTGTWSPYPWLPSLSRIDYVLVDREVEVQGSWAVDLPGSDHRVVIADLRLE